MLYIFTPAYNREKCLHRLYSSLISQTSKEFIWLVINDGSTDNTENLVKSWQKENKIKIIYLYQRNQGKHIAYNTALKFMGEKGFHVCVDSDDRLSQGAVETFLEDISAISENNLYIGIVYPKNENRNENTQKWVSTAIETVRIQDIKLKYGLNIETCIVMKNAYVSSFRFPIFENEKFVSEEIMYIYTGKYGGFRPINKVVYYFEYLEDGLTKNIFQLWKKNPQGTLYFLEQRKQYIKENFNGFEKFRELCKVKLNINAFRLTQNDIKWTKGYSLIDYFLIPISLFVKYRRFD
ncbi:glycosyltransferase family A protein [Streptococcus suis]|uniref:glycosyltransferase family A protein n=1 Tax=Streptococcus suis TaxID=1307 RepID=UPI0014781024|nr:glycosyltransferase family 2 protein [Streptococcus suis]